MPDKLSSIRRDYSQGTLIEEQLPSNPTELVRGWLQYALERNVPDANAVSLATLDLDGYPTTRIVLLRDISDLGLNFFTNYQSAKSQEMMALSRGTLSFFWSTLERQIRVRGTFEKVSEADSDAYFATRPRSSQIGAWASPQSEVLENREELDQLVAEYEQRFAGQISIPRPPHWGGYRLVPNRFEFWQGRPSRLHDRFRADPEGSRWVWKRLAP